MSFTVASSALTRPAEQALLNSSLSIAPSLFESTMVKFRTRGEAASFASVSPPGEAMDHAAAHFSAGTATSAACAMLPAKPAPARTIKYVRVESFILGPPCVFLSFDGYLEVCRHARK